MRLFRAVLKHYTACRFTTYRRDLRFQFDR
jgi:hypothetical protein